MPTRPPVFRPDASRSPAAYDAERRAVSMTRRLYGTARWRRLRASQLAAEPLCRFCIAEGRATEAIVADHVTPHRGDVTAFWFGELQSLCEPHHNAAKQREEAKARDGGSQSLHP